MDAQTNITSILVVLSVAVAIGIIVLFYESLSALMAPKAKLSQLVASPASELRARLLLEKDGLLRALRDLQGDHERGKTSVADFENEKKAIVRKLSALKERLDREVVAELKEADLLIQKALAEEAAVNKPQAKINFCDSCETENDVDADFCKKCGTKLRGDDA